MRSLLCCRKGTALIEFALILPVVLLLLVGTVELSRFAIIQMKLDKASNAMSDFVTQGSTVSRANLTTFASTMPQIMKPFDFSGSVVFTSLATDTNNGTGVGNNNQVCRNCIVWQFQASGGDGSQLGNVGSSARLPNNYRLRRRHNIIAAEVYYNYSPILPITSAIISSLSPHKIYKISLSKPRTGTLTVLQ